MGSGIPRWSGAVGSCLAIQASILIVGFLLGPSQRFEAKGRVTATSQQPKLQDSLINEGGRTMAAKLSPSITER